MMENIFEPGLRHCIPAECYLLIHDDDDVERTFALLILLFNSRPSFVLIHFICMTCSQQP